MNAGYKHSSKWNSSKWSFGDVVWHRSTKDKGIIVAIHLDEQPTAIEKS
jgi:hypothetical protein